MKNLKRIRYNTLNSWNNSKAPAYNLKVYNVINNDLQQKVYELMEADGFYDEINLLISDFDAEQGYLWQAGFNGRSGGYLVLYKGSYEKKYIYKEEDFKNTEYKGRVYADRYGWKSFEEAKEQGLINKEILITGYCAGMNIKDNEVPAKVLKDFRRLAINIVRHVEYMAKHASIEIESYTEQKIRKVINI